MKDKYPELVNQMTRIYANTTKWEREITQDEARALIEWSWKEMDKANKVDREVR